MFTDSESSHNLGNENDIMLPYRYPRLGSSFFDQGLGGVQSRLLAA